MSDIKEAGSNLARDFRRWVADTRGHVAAIRDGAEEIPGELSRIGDHLAVEVQQQGFWQIAIFSVGLLFLGYGFQQLYWMGTRGWRKRVLATPLETVAQRLDVVGQRLAYNLLWLLSFAVGSLGALLLFNWPPYLKSLLSAIFLTIVVAILWGALARFLLSPNNPKLRVFPTSDASARHWSRWDVILLAWFFGGYMAMQVLQDFDIDRAVRLPIAYFLGMVLFVLAMVALWRRPALVKGSEERRSRAFNVTLGVSVLFAAFWALWFFGMMKAFWLLLVMAGLPAAISVGRSVGGPRSDASRGRVGQRGRPA